MASRKAGVEALFCSRWCRESVLSLPRLEGGAPPMDPCPAHRHRHFTRCTTRSAVHGGVSRADIHYRPRSHDLIICNDKDRVSRWFQHLPTWPSSYVCGMIQQRGSIVVVLLLRDLCRPLFVHSDSLSYSHPLYFGPPRKPYVCHLQPHQHGGGWPTHKHCPWPKPPWGCINHGRVAFVTAVGWV